MAKMLGRKQSLKGTEPVLADYGPDDNYVDRVDWVSRVSDSFSSLTKFIN